MPIQVINVTDDLKSVLEISDHPFYEEFIVTLKWLRTQTDIPKEAKFGTIKALEKMFTEIIFGPYGVENDKRYLSQCSYLGKMGLIIVDRDKVCLEENNQIDVTCKWLMVCLGDSVITPQLTFYINLENPKQIEVFSILYNPGYPLLDVVIPSCLIPPALIFHSLENENKSRQPAVKHEKARIIIASIEEISPFIESINKMAVKLGKDGIEEMKEAEKSFRQAQPELKEASEAFYWFKLIKRLGLKL